MGDRRFEDGAFGVFGTFGFGFFTRGTSATVIIVGRIAKLVLVFILEQGRDARQGISPRQFADGANLANDDGGRGHGRREGDIIG